MGLSPKNRDDRVRVSNAASLLYTLQESKTPVEISLILGWGEGIFARPRSPVRSRRAKEGFSAAAEFRAPQSGVRRN